MGTINSIFMIGLAGTVLFFINPEGSINFATYPGYIFSEPWYEVIFISLFSPFLHGSFFHFIGNAFSLYFFSQRSILGDLDILKFFLFQTIFTGVSIHFLALGPTIGLSGFGCGLLSIAILEAKKRNQKEWKSGLFLLILLVLTGLTGNISFIGHLSGGIAGFLFYFFKGFQRN